MDATPDVIKIRLFLGWLLDNGEWAGDPSIDHHAYTATLGALSEEVLKEMAKRSFREFRFFPRPSELWDMAQRIFQEAVPIPSWRIAWQRIPVARKHYQALGGRERRTLLQQIRFENPVTDSVVRRIGLRMILESGDEVFLRQEFKDLYQEHIQLTATQFLTGNSDEFTRFDVSGVERQRIGAPLSGADITA